MRKAPRTGPGPLCRAAAGWESLEEPEEKPPPAVCAQHCLSGGQIRLQLALAGSMDLAPGSFLHLAQGYPADWDGRDWGRGRKVQERKQRVSQELELLQSRK